MVNKTSTISSWYNNPSYVESRKKTFTVEITKGTDIVSIDFEEDQRELVMKIMREFAEKTLSKLKVKENI